MGTIAQLIVKADLIQADLDFLTQVELEPTADFTYVDNNDGTFDLTDATTIHTAGFVVPNVSVTEWRWENLYRVSPWALLTPLPPLELSSAAAPTFTVALSGTYKVKLTPTTNYGWQDTITKDVAIVIDPTADFTYATERLDVDHINVIVKDTSIGDGGSSITSRVWTWGDGTPTEALGSGEHIHTYDQTTSPVTIRLTVTTNLGGSHFVDKVVSWTALIKYPIADFDWNQTGVLAVSFVDESYDINTGGSITAWLWDFGDGTTSTSQNPSHTFPAYETYNVKLTATNNFGKTNLIDQDVRLTAPPADPEPPIADFSWDKNSLAVTFTDASIAVGSIVEWLWDFGDGETLGKTSAPGNVHTYANYGTYDVKLIVTDDNGKKDELVVTVIIEDNSILTPPTAGFTVATPAPLQRALTDTSAPGTGTITTWLYEWGDGSSNSYGASALRTHTYAGTQVYTIRLTVTDDNLLAHTYSEAVDLRFDITNAIAASFTVDSCSIQLIS